MIVLKYERKSMYCPSISTTKAVLFPNGHIPKEIKIRVKKVAGIKNEMEYINPLLFNIWLVIWCIFLFCLILFILTMIKISSF